MDRKQKALGEILINKGLVSPGQLKATLEEQADTKEFIGAILVRRKFIAEKDLQAALSVQFGLPFVDLKSKYVDWKLVGQFSPSLILEYKCFPLKKDDWSVTYAILNPLDAQALKKAEEEARGLKVNLTLTSFGAMDELIHRYKQYRRSEISRLFGQSKE